MGWGDRRGSVGTGFFLAGWDRRGCGRSRPEIRGIGRCWTARRLRALGLTSSAAFVLAIGGAVSAEAASETLTSHGVRAAADTLPSSQVTSTAAAPVSTVPTASLNPINPTLIQEQLAEANARDTAWEAKQAAEADTAQSASDPTTYSDESPSAAWTTDEKAFAGWLTSSVYTGPPVGVGETLERIIGDHDAVIGDGSRRAVLFSTLPLNGITPTGTSAPINLALQTVAGGYQATSAAVPVTLPGTANGQVQFPNGLSFSIPSAEGQAAQVDNNRLFFANITGEGGDTDLVMQPRQTGAEVSFVLRSPAATRTGEALQFNLPASDKLELTGPSNSVQGAQIVDGDGSLVASIMPPTASDAVGRSVPATYSIAGADTLVVTTTPSAGAVYPLLVDPLVAAWDPGMYASWTTAEGAGEPSDDFAFSTSNSPYTQTLWSGDTAGSADVWGEYLYPSVPGAYVYEEYSDQVDNYPNNSAEGGGIWNPATGWYAAGSWADSTANGSGPGGSGTGIAGREQTGSEEDVDTDYCAGGTTAGVDDGDSGVYAGACPIPAHGVVAADNEATTASNTLQGNQASPGLLPQVDVYGDYLYESDDITPTITDTTSFCGGWLDGGCGSVGASASVSTGLGLATLSLLDNGSTTDNWTNSCANGYPCGSNITINGWGTYPLAEGVNDFTVQATDFGGNAATTNTIGTECLDLNAPTMAVSGNLWNSSSTDDDVVVAGSSDTLTISATDGENDGQNADQASGVQAVDASVVEEETNTQMAGFGEVPNSSAAPTTINCGGQQTPADASQQQTWTVNTKGWLPGLYDVTVEATDNAGNTTSQSSTIDLVSDGGTLGNVATEGQCVVGELGVPDPSQAGLCGELGTVEQDEGDAVSAANTVQNAAAPTISTAASDLAPYTQDAEATVEPDLSPAFGTLGPLTYQIVNTSNPIIGPSGTLPAPGVPGGLTATPAASSTTAVLSEPPAFDYSIYVYSGDTYGSAKSTAYQWGYHQAIKDASRGVPGFVTLDFGAEAAANEVELTDGTTKPDSFVTGFVQWFAAGYTAGADNDSGQPFALELNIGTNNGGDYTNGSPTASGTAWGKLITQLAGSTSGSVLIEGASDMEYPYGNWAVTKAWVQAFESAEPNALLVDYGDASGCADTFVHGDYATADPCDFGWQGLYNLIWGFKGSIGQPEVYYDGCDGDANQPIQWANVAAFDPSKHLPVMAEALNSGGGCLTNAQSYNHLTSALRRVGDDYRVPYEGYISGGPHL